MSWIFQSIGECLGCVDRHRPENRTVFVANNPPSQAEVYIPEKFCDNRVVSSNYTVWNFLPKNLFEQFRRIANFYFLCVGIIQLTIDTPVSPVTSILPLVFVITVTAVKQGYEDWLRHKADNEVNNRPAWVLRNGHLVEVKSMHVEVGDIVRVQVNHGFPCDMVMLSSSEPEGECTVTTANLDGETNLKTFCALQETKSLQTEDKLEKLKSTIECQQPITDLYRFVGRITIENSQTGETVVKPLGPENVLLRGARLRNTPYVYGCAIYTGQETKMALNSKFKTAKFSRVERSMNFFLVTFLIILVLETSLCFGLRYFYLFHQPEGVAQPWYAPKEDKLTVLKVIDDFFAFVVLFNYIIPISLYVTVEVQKFCGSMFFGWDCQIYDESTNSRAKANTSDLNEELGQVEYLFTDKTGTLTENDMQFRQCSINGTKYIEVGGMLCYLSDIPDDHHAPVTSLNNEIEEFLMVLVLCHTVRLDHKDHHINNGLATAVDDHTFEYQASSPDEKAFVDACRRYGVVYHGMKDDYQQVTFKGEVRNYRLFYVLDFDATRKCMSTIVQLKNGDYYLLCKGAESSVLDRCKSGSIDKTLCHVNDYAKLGLRTLVIAHRKLTEEEFQDFDHKLSEAKKALDKREEKLAEVYNTVEQNLHCLGATAIEDKLQEGVPHTICSLREAGIKIWVLTGDKEETAVNISYSAGHFKPGIGELRLTKLTSSMECAELLSQHIKTISDGASRGITYALVVDGVSLHLALKDHRAMFKKLCTLCQTVLCCRMSPLQKAEVVRLIKQDSSHPVTAAIGDGANDVSMIQEAHVGLGIMGKEGRQAVRCSDYAFGQFRFLKRILLFHGHIYYVRLSTLVQFFFYKNVAFITAQLYYAFFSSFTAQSIYDSFFLLFYNVTFTSLGIFIYGLFEHHIPQEKLLSTPSLYKKVSRNARLSGKEFLKWNLLGLWHSLVFFFGVYFLIYKNNSLLASGQMDELFSMGTVIISLCVLVVNMKLCLESYYLNAVVHFSFWFTITMYLVFLMVYSGFMWPSYFVDQQYMYWVFYHIYSSPAVWFTVLLLVVMALLPDLVLRVIKDTFLDDTGQCLPHNRVRNNSSQSSNLTLSENTPLNIEPVRFSALRKSEEVVA